LFLSDKINEAWIPIDPLLQHRFHLPPCLCGILDWSKASSNVGAWGDVHRPPASAFVPAVWAAAEAVCPPLGQAGALPVFPLYH